MFIGCQTAETIRAPRRLVGNISANISMVTPTKSRAKGVHIKMREFLNIFLLIINIISFVLVLLFGASGIIYELFGPASYEKILQKLKIPWSFERIWLFMFVCLIILIITYILRKKFFNVFSPFSDR